MFYVIYGVAREKMGYDASEQPKTKNDSNGCYELHEINNEDDKQGATKS